jgi:hypothetical protein
MSLFSKALHGIGHLAEKAAPYVGLIPGVGTLAGGAIGGLGGLAAGDGLGGALKYGLQGAAGGLAGGGIKSAITGALASRGGGSAPSGGGYDVSDPNQNIFADGSGPSAAVPPSALPGGSGSSGTNPWLMGLAGLEGANSAYLGKKANDYSQSALKSVTGAYNEKAPLRTAALQGLLHPAAPDTSKLGAIQSRNPYAVGA